MRKLFYLPYSLYLWVSVIYLSLLQPHFPNMIYGKETKTEIIIPSSFSPNGDGNEDSLIILNLEHYPNNQLIVFEQSGKEVFRAKNYKNDWNGYSNEKLPLNGLYFYFFENGEGKTYSGYIQIDAGKP